MEWSCIDNPEESPIKLLGQIKEPALGQAKVRSRNCSIFPMGILGTQALWPPPLAFQDALAGKWVGSRKAET